MSAQDIFCRVEKKYILTQAQHEQLLDAITGHMQQDEYGLHTINNLYLDTEDFALVRASLDKPVYKEKLRLRSYGTPDAESIVFLEIKKKFKDVVYKRRVAMSLKEADAYLNHGIKPQRTGQILREIDYLMQHYDHPTAKAFIAYDRSALFCPEDSELRITFDTNIRFRNTLLDLSKGSWGQPVLGSDQVLMEIKVPGVMPMWLSHVLSELSIYPTSFSKYGSCYQQFIMPKPNDMEGFPYAA